MTKKLALVTNVKEFVGPPAVTALLESAFKVIAHDPAFFDSDEREKYQDENPDTVAIDIQDPKECCSCWKTWRARRNR
jgi:hypothetical protein